MTTRKRQLRKAVFLDRDGVLNEMVYDETHGVMDSPMLPSQVRAVRGAGSLLRGLRRRGYFVCVATNQPGIAKGTLTLKRLEAIHAKLARLLAEEGGRWDDLRFCPHHPAGGARPRKRYVRDCACRKPKPGLLLAAAKAHGLDLGASWMVGDGLTDIRAGRAAGCRTILVSRVKIHDIERFVRVKGAEPDRVVSRVADVFKVIAGRRRASA